MRLIAMLILTGSSLGLAAAPPLKLIDIYRAGSDRALPPVPAGFSRAVTSFAFSPNERWIAVTLHARATQPGVTTASESTLLLLPLNTGDRRRVEIDPRTQGVVFWSQDSQSVVVYAQLGKARGVPRIYNLHGELTWTGPQSGPILGFIAPERLLAYHAKANGRAAGFDTIDIPTSAVTPWRGPGHRPFAAIDPARGLLAVFSDSAGSKTLIFDYATGNVVQSVKNGNQTTVFAGSACEGGQSGICETNVLGAPQVFFVENGSSLCEAALVGAFRSHPVCRDVDTGETISEFRDVDGGSPASASTRGSRMVLSKLNHQPGGYPDGTMGRVIWDFRSGSEVAAWKPAGQQTAWLGPFGVSGVSAPGVAISPSGNYVAELLGTELRIYQIP